MDHLDNAKTCNFCGSSDLDIFTIGADVRYVHCNGCQANGPEKCSEECAVRAWNRDMPRSERNPEPTESESKDESE